MLTDDDRRARIRSALRLLIDPGLPWVHDEDHPNCGECWECIAGTLGIARAMRRSGLQTTDALYVDDRLVWLNSALAKAQSRVGDLEAQVGESLSRTRLAMTALDLGDETEAQAILSALCGMLVEAGAVDPMEEQ